MQPLCLHAMCNIGLHKVTTDQISSAHYLMRMRCRYIDHREGENKECSKEAISEAKEIQFRRSLET